MNRRRAIPADFPLDGRSAWTPCVGSLPPSLAARGIDLLCLPREYTLTTPEALRSLAWDSPAPSFSSTRDGLPVGAGGRVGFRPMIDEARRLGYDIRIRSGFRPYVSQGIIFRAWVQQQRMLGYPEDEAVRRAEASSARAGHSEHQLGTTADLVYREPGGALYQGWDARRIAASEPMGWVHRNAHRFGLVVSYDRDATAITGYVWEPWHLRFVGVEVADELRCRGIPLEAWLRERYGMEER
ncbi:MAG: M15 family metallopeptidase [Myxococcales bacterium]|nr:M15 family metallopeptidase [Myxococcales bacterium]